jgi:hypothetical protein
MGFQRPAMALEMDANRFTASGRLLDNATTAWVSAVTLGITLSARSQVTRVTCSIATNAATPKTTSFNLGVRHPIDSSERPSPLITMKSIATTVAI